MSFPNHAQYPDQQIPLQEVQQPNNLINNQQPLQSHVNATPPPPPIQQQQQQAFQPQQAQYPPIPNAAQEVRQPSIYNHQQPLQGQFNATPPPIQQQQQQQQAFQPQQAQYPPFPNAQQQPQPMPQYAHAPPALAQGSAVAAPLDNGHAGSGNAGDKDRKNSLVRAKLQFKGRDIWVGGESSVGRKDKDGKWTEARGCSVM